ncbi:uncharacterized protein YdiU (UPF0061 family) [Actinoplanes octamycinicus]|uniref:Protein nucleotidyltransferase YdiU n=1 Tax=Actinoplanes octamycinicus TaxID=135948 RepID=A0A7W7M8Y8_9ACTN|nr:YdiU family protein [Actinoplanes octamycinicus]MBB4741315.1 uncharacterized protein YdiU (UPF0061 family) [Actinoplanes octamycinicus]GIE62885.1 UPF0061 protein [Actinoplanes octamycinicus]
MDVSAPAVTLTHRFADELPELAIAWRAEDCPAPRVLIADQRLAAELGLAPEQLTTGLLTGTEPPAGAHPVAQAYAGHQFGGYSPRLGDGRALLLGEIDGRDLHLKGSGRTPFARGGDGLAAVGPMLREFVVSTAMHALGIPTTRSLAVVATGRTVHREGPLPGAVLARVAASHLRVGSFQFARATGDTGLLRRLADHAISRHYPELTGDYLGFFDAVVAAQASLIARWMLVGFVHGVMNTDNMTISGETIDYGPCAFMEAVDPATVYSSIDTGGRYAYGNQPAIAQWNLARFAESLLPLLHDDQEQAVPLAVSSLERFGGLFDAAWTAGMHEKLGLTTARAQAATADPDVAAHSDADEALVTDLAAILRDARVDYTSFFRTLARAARGEADPARALFPDPTDFDSWLPRWLALKPDAAVMDRVNPIYIPRNHLVEEALAAATEGDLAPVERLVEVVAAPFEERPGLARYADPAPGDFGPYRTFCGT